MSVAVSQLQTFHERKNSVQSCMWILPKSKNATGLFAWHNSISWGWPGKTNIAGQGWDMRRLLDVLGSQKKKCIPNIRIGVQYKLFKTKTHPPKFGGIVGSAGGPELLQGKPSWSHFDFSVVGPPLQHSMARLMIAWAYPSTARNLQWHPFQHVLLHDGGAGTHDEKSNLVHTTDECICGFVTTEISRVYN